MSAPLTATASASSLASTPSLNSPPMSPPEDLTDSQTTDSSSSVRIGRWTKQEHAKFMEAYKLFGKDWRRVADFVGTRNNVQVRTHAQKSFKKLRNQELARMRAREAGRRMEYVSFPGSHVSYMVPQYSSQSMFPGAFSSATEHGLLSPHSPLATHSSAAYFSAKLPAFDAGLSASGLAQQQAALGFNATLFPHLTTFSPLGGVRPLPPAPGPTTVAPGLGVKQFFPDWTVNVK